MSSNNIETLVEQLSSLTIIEAAELSKALEEKWGVTAAVGMAAAPAAALVEEKTEFDLNNSNTTKSFKRLNALK
jgi:large subunit ribosomal protein L7/L12